MMGMKCGFKVDGTVVANEFIDCYMGAANGEYVKVYLYLLRHDGRPVSVDEIADALNHTEADIRRALAYWEKLGVLEQDEEQPPPAKEAALRVTGIPDDTEASGDAASLRETAAADAGLRAKTRPRCSPEQIRRLGEDEDFTQLIYIAQKYMNKIFTQRDSEVFAYLYDSLHMSAELLEYLVEHCVQSGHTGIRYIETVALSWHEKGFASVEEARTYAESFSKNTFAVMRAFGQTGRMPGLKEKEYIEKWFRSYGFTKELVLEACNRTMDLVHTPSFQYADKILSEWKEAGVHTMRDVSMLDEKHQARSRKAPRGRKKPVNQFHNFEQRDTDYDSLVLEQVKSWIQE